MRSTVVTALVALIIASASGCGWQPRGAQELPPALAELRVVSEMPGNALEYKLRRALNAAGVTLREDAGKHYSMHLAIEERSARKVSLDRSARSAEQEMSLSVNFELRDPDNIPVLGPRQVSASRIYSYDPNSVIAKQDEENLIYQELQDNLIGQILRQVRSADLGERS
jgi:LPS-assembly lipoprotein